MQASQFRELLSVSLAEVSDRTHTGTGVGEGVGLGVGLGVGEGVGLHRHSHSGICSAKGVFSSLCSQQAFYLQ